ncbi:very short patch repair endonuclease [Mucilaginibacter aquatilis]|uniref:Very short patch repair endonuclease n=1 Tax=Mucilaginibacter aquatilis TaxID=1517760 RepID=A0A6I4I8C8_9SPHI|nr:DNA mismatch endonuclease Vsr [Mucilaginibacter aquatilis]MVN91460.1 DNA mismatch endonuclease Vsr [Mucilaginibacter aquatilis]
MADVHSPAVRSFNMSRIRGKNTRPEMLVRRFLFSQGFRYRLHDKKLPGKPDIVLPRYRTVIFVHGCFWHGHDGCRYFVVPKTRTEWWTEKINRNIDNDHKSVESLKQAGWHVLNVWECDLKKDKIRDTLTRLVRDIRHM